MLKMGKMLPIHKNRAGHVLNIEHIKLVITKLVVRIYFF